MKIENDFPKIAETIISVHPNAAPGILVRQISQIRNIAQIWKWSHFVRLRPWVYTRRGHDDGSYTNSLTENVRLVDLDFYFVVVHVADHVRIIVHVSMRASHFLPYGSYSVGDVDDYL